MMTNVEFTKNVNFMTPGAGVLVQGRGHISHIVKMHQFFKKPLLYSLALTRQSKHMMKEGSTKIVNFMTPGAGVLVLGHDHNSHIEKMHYLLLYQYRTHISIVLTDYAAFLCRC